MWPDHFCCVIISLLLWVMYFFSCTRKILKITQISQTFELFRFSGFTDLSGIVSWNNCFSVRGKNLQVGLVITTACFWLMTVSCSCVFSLCFATGIFIHVLNMFCFSIFSLLNDKCGSMLGFFLPSHHSTSGRTSILALLCILRHMQK